MERCEPGTPLSAAGAGAALDVLIGLLPRLWLAAGPPFHTLADEAAWWAGYLPGEWEAAGRPFERRLLDAAVEALAALAPTQGEQVLLHQDLHGDNVLAGAARAVACDRPQAARRRARVRGRADRALGRARPLPPGGAAPARPADGGAPPRPRARPRLDDRPDGRVGDRRPGRAPRRGAVAARPVTIRPPRPDELARCSSRSSAPPGARSPTTACPRSPPTTRAASRSSRPYRAAGGAWVAVDDGDSPIAYIVTAEVDDGIAHRAGERRPGPRRARDRRGADRPRRRARAGAGPHRRHADDVPRHPLERALLRPARVPRAARATSGGRSCEL